MEQQETRSKTKLISAFLGTAGILFFISSGLGILPWNYAVFAGIACFIIAGAIRRNMLS